jgi:phosphocarrier protein HPr
MKREIVITNARGLHARASAKFVKCAEQFEADIKVSRDGQTVPATSIMGLMMLAAHPGANILVEAEGPDAAAALDALETLVVEKFGED